MIILIIKIIMIISFCDNHDYHDNLDKQDNHMPKNEIKPIFVRLTAAERRRVRTLAVSQGLTMREAVVHAFEAWASQIQSRAKGSAAPRTAAAASPPSVGGRPKTQRPASTGQPVGPPAGGGSLEEGPSLADVPGLAALAEGWPLQALQLDWSKCPAAEIVQTKRGPVWVAAGTLTPLAHIFEAVAGGNPPPEIAEVYGLTMQQLLALLQFAAEGAASPASGG